MGIDEAAKTGYYRTLLTGVQHLTVVSISPSRYFVMVDQVDAFMRELNHFLDTDGAPGGSKNPLTAPSSPGSASIGP